MISRRLLRAYAATDYRIPAAHLSLTPDRRSPALIAWLRRRQVRRIAIVTACNPRSRLLSEQENAARNAAMAAELRAADLHFVAANGRGHKGDWPEEPGFAIFDIGLAKLDALGRRWGQNAALLAEQSDGRPYFRFFTSVIG